MLVKEKNLTFLLNQILKEQSLCLKLINHLYLFGSNRWISIINYVQENDNNLLPEEELKKLLNKIPKDEEILKRKLTLT